MLQSFAGERRAAGRAAEQEAAAARIGGGPDEVADALEAEHRVEDEERNRVDAVRRVRRAGGDPRRNRSGLGDAFFENLPVLRFLVVEQRRHVDRLVELADARVDADRAEERLHAERPRFVRHDRHDELADLLVAQQLRQHLHEHHRRRGLAAVGALRGTRRRRRSSAGLNRRRGDDALRHEAAERRAALLHVRQSRGSPRRAGRTARPRCGRPESARRSDRGTTCRSASFIFFCWCVMFLPSPASPRP